LCLALILLDSFIGFLWVVLILSFVGLFFILWNQFILPYWKLKALELPNPIQVGDAFDFVVPDSERQGRFSIGKKLSDLNTLCSHISEDHLVFDIKKNNENEEYSIVVTRNGPTLFKPPRMDVYSKMEAREKIEGYEIIGHFADFRISDKIVKERMVNYIEIRLSTSYFFNKYGKERMKFTFTVIKIHPGFNRTKRNRDGCFGWGQEEIEQESEETEKD